MQETDDLVADETHLAQEEEEERDDSRLLETASDSARADEETFPWKKVLPIALVTMAEGFQGSVLIPFVVSSGNGCRMADGYGM